MKTIIKKTYVEGRETVNLCTINTEYKATMTCNDYEKICTTPPFTVNDNAIIQIVSVEGS